MSHNNLSNHAIGLLADALKDNSTLTELFMTHNDLSQPNGIAFIQCFNNKNALKSLALNNCKLNLSLIEALSLSMKNNENLKELYLYSNSIKPNEARFVSDMISNKRKLTTLGLSNNEIGEEGAIYLA